VAADESAGALTVRATSAADTSKSGTAAVTVSGVTVSPARVSVPKGGTRQFSAVVVTGADNPSQAVTWTVTGGTGTSAIDTTGLLTVAAGESTGTTLTVRATSVADTSQSGTAVVTVTKPVQSIAITRPPDKTEYLLGEDLDLTGLVVTVTFDDNTTEPAAIADLTVSGYDKTTPGNYTVTVSCGGKTASFSVKVSSTGDYEAFIGSQGYASLEEAVSAAAGKTAVITVVKDISRYYPIALNAANTHITLRGDGTERVITASSSNSTDRLFTLSGSSLTLDEGITLRNIYVDVGSGGTFTMKGGSFDGGGGVYVGSGGTFTMEGGSIAGNHANVYNNGDASGCGGGVYVAANGTFTMEDGSITGNDADGSSDENGSIRGRAYAYGGGVYVAANGTFTMRDSSVKGNTASIGYNTTGSGTGGGVYLARFSIFSKTGGTIYGNDAASADQKNKVTGYTDRGAAVYVDFESGTALKRLEKTVDAAHNLTKAETDTTAESLTPEKGWTE
jgi:hypothetical protein